MFPILCPQTQEMFKLSSTTFSVGLIAILAEGTRNNISLYVDGVFTAKAVGKLSLIQHQHKLQAVQVDGNSDDDVFFLASSSNGVRTDRFWKCTNVYHDGWFLPSYNDTSWPGPYVSNGNDGRNIIAPDAKWIGYQIQSNKLYCRRNATTGMETFLHTALIIIS